jgi:hypothetical protein
MSETKFTPSPWSFDKAADGNWHIRDASGNSMMCDEEYYPWVPDNEADWNLIAAAPDMYTQLVKMRDSMNCVCKINKIVEPLGAGIECQVCSINAILSKAEGKAVANG